MTGAKPLRETTVSEVAESAEPAAESAWTVSGDARALWSGSG
jgi:hypothetical protein